MFECMSELGQEEKSAVTALTTEMGETHTHGMCSPARPSVWAS